MQTQSRHSALESALQWHRLTTCWLCCVVADLTFANLDVDLTLVNLDVDLTLVNLDVDPLLNLDVDLTLLNLDVDPLLNLDVDPLANPYFAPPASFLAPLNH